MVTDDILPGGFSQDIFPIVFSLALLFLAWRTEESDYLNQVIVLGILGFLFYAYGIYVIEQIYTVLYLLSLAIFGLSEYAILCFLINIRRSLLSKVTLSNRVRPASLVMLIVTPLVFYPLWTGQLIPQIETGDKLEFLFSIYFRHVLHHARLRHHGSEDVQVQGNRPTAHPLFILGIGVLSPLALAELLKPVSFDMGMEVEGVVLFAIFSIIHFILALVHLRSVRVFDEGKVAEPKSHYCSLQ